ncbi:MAG: hypothetical protein ACR2OX_05250, partial [Methyloligellaceae bacterium]
MASANRSVSATIAGMGISVPHQSMPSSEIDARLGKPEGWLESKCGVRTRPVRSGDETQISMGVAAAKMALSEAGLKPGDL